MAKVGNRGDVADVEAGVEHPKHPKDREMDAKKEEMEIIEVPLSPLSKIWGVLGPRDHWFVALGILGSIIVGALSPCEAILTANIVNNFYTVDANEMLEENLKWIFPFAYAFATAALIGNAFIGIGLSRSGNRLGNNFRKLAFTAILKRSIGWFDDPDHTVGELTTILGADAESTMRLTGWQLGYRVRVLSSIGTGITISLVFSWQIGLTALACFPLIMLASIVQAFMLSRKYSAAVEGLTPPTILEQGLRSISSIQAYNLEPKVSNDYDVALEPESKSKVQQGAVTGLVYGFTQGVVFLSFGIIFYVGTQLLVGIQINFLQFFAALLSVMFGAIGAVCSITVESSRSITFVVLSHIYALSIYCSIALLQSQVSADFSAQQEGRASAARLLSVTEGPEDDPDDTVSTATIISDFQGSVSFENGQFAYPSRPDNMIFYQSSANDNKGLNLTVNAKESLGLVGRSGSGKSTVLQLVLRFYDLTSGRCNLDGSNVQDVNIKWLRQQIGYVGQMPTLFTGTVKENILLGKPDATEDEMVAAATAAHAHDFVSSFSNGYDTDIGTGGGNLSGGQKQRIAIARAIIGNPKIMVLDEATAALDNESEKMVQAALDSLQDAQPRTTLVVAHRLLTIKNCTRIVFLGYGGVLEIGSFDELVAQKGEFYELWKMQGAEEELNKER
jgi:ATP-binding cassette, subfamily B (MDR/TAP), member 1